MSQRETILNSQQVADLMGAHVETIRRLARKGAIPAFKMGKDWRFRRHALVNWVRKGSDGLQQPHVMVVDDDVAICKQIRRILESADWRVHAVPNGQEGLVYTKAHALDLILLDLDMPVMNGPQFLHHLRKMNCPTPVVIITGYPDGDLMEAAMDYGPLLLLAKPIEKAHLLATAGVVCSTAGQARKDRLI